MGKFSLLIRRTKKIDIDQQVSLLKIQFPAVLPENLKEISLIKVMQMRNKRDFTQKRKAFRSVLEKVATAIENGNESTTLHNELESAYRDFKDDIALLGTGLTNIALGIWLAVNNKGFGPLLAVKQILEGTAFTVGSTIKIRKTWTNSITTRIARRYVADLKNLHR